MHVRRGDTVEVITGHDKGKTGQVLMCHPEKERILVQGVNIVVKHQRKSRDNPYGVRTRREAPIHVSNVLLYCGECGGGRRYHIDVREDEKVRICKKCGKEIPKGSL